MSNLKQPSTPQAVKGSKGLFLEQVDEYADLKHPVPCLFLPNKNVVHTSKVVVYFHGNAEDVGLAAEMLDYIRYIMHVSRSDIAGSHSRCGVPRLRNLRRNTERRANSGGRVQRLRFPRGGVGHQARADNSLREVDWFRASHPPGCQPQSLLSPPHFPFHLHQRHRRRSCG